MHLDTHAKWPSIALLTLCQVLALSLWFAATAIIPALRVEIDITDTQASLYTSVVSVGFVFGTLASAILSLNVRCRAQSSRSPAPVRTAGHSHFCSYRYPSSSVR